MYLITVWIHFDRKTYVSKSLLLVPVLEQNALVNNRQSLVPRKDNLSFSFVISGPFFSFDNTSCNAGSFLVTNLLAVIASNLCLKERVRTILLDVVSVAVV